MNTIHFAKSLKSLSCYDLWQSFLSLHFAKVLDFGKVEYNDN
ncbi:hypothetical protein [Capnocytophaga ochracea]|uniref:Uncharacterized protein n=1 Tax=Capnocytophaga ochracea TaxID=1018 RepID=A0AA46W8C4_CAPOC|nr:hypothetical protein [Capnocytophaga ochracea]UZD40803.1 hypothetical protein OL231_11630 [Capnocytophaga ochracea]